MQRENERGPTMQTKTPSLRQIAAELEISPAYLSYMVNGKRPWRRDLYQRYMGVVNTFVNSEGASVNKPTRPLPQKRASIGLNWSGGGEGNRTLGPLHAKQVLSR